MKFDNKFEAFILEERENYNGYDNNRFAFSIAQVLRYYVYLLIIKDRYDSTNEEYDVLNNKLREIFRKKIGQLSNKDISIFNKQRELSEKIHLEIESFYIFSSIFLDKLAQFVQDYFGNVRGKSLSSHKKLLKNVNDYATKIGIKGISPLLSKGTKIYVFITDYRDKQITHQKNPRTIRGTGFDEEGETNILTTYLYPNEGEISGGSIESLPLGQLLVLAEEYFDNVVNLIKSNRGKSRYSLKNI